MDGHGQEPATDPSDAKPPFDPWGPARLAVKVLWTLASVYIAYVWAGIVTLRHRSRDYCPPPDPGPLLPCWPTFSQDAWANVEAWAWGIGVFVAFTTPLWLSFLIRRRGRGRAR